MSGLDTRYFIESDGNFIQLLKLEDDQAVVDWLQRKCNKYTSHEVQNEILKIMALHVLRVIATSLQSSQFLTVMIDKTTDISNCKQVVIVSGELQIVLKYLKILWDYIMLIIQV